MTTRTWETNAGQYGEMVNETEGWYFGLLVACSVYPSDAAAPKSVNKVSATDFAQKAGVPRDSRRGPRGYRPRPRQLLAASSCFTSR